MYRDIDPNMKDQALADMAAGMRQKEVTEKYGVSATTVSNWYQMAKKKGRFAEKAPKPRRRKQPGGEQQSLPAGVNVIPPAMHHSPWLGFVAKIKEEAEGD